MVWSLEEAREPPTKEVPAKTKLANDLKPINGEKRFCRGFRIGSLVVIVATNDYRLKKERKFFVLFVAFTPTERTHAFDSD